MIHDDGRGHATGPNSSLTIRVTMGSGKGRTALAAFDSALRNAGVADHNLIRLSSVIPPGSVVRICSPAEQLRGSFGDAMYCVYAAAYAIERGDDAVAGVGWSLASDGSGRGLFVEHTGHAEEQVSTMIQTTLADMSTGRAEGFAFADQLLQTAHCSGQPACSVVVATYRTTGWDGP